MRRLVVHPDTDRVEEALVEAATGAAIVDASGSCTFAQLVERCEPLQQAERALASPLLVRCLVGRHAPALAAEAFGRVARTAEFAASLGELLAHLRSQGATPEALARAAAGSPPGLARRAEAVAAVLRAVEADLSSLGLVDPGATLTLAAQRLERGLPPRLAGFAAIELRAVHDLSPARLRFLEALAKACTRAGGTLSLHWPGAGDAHADVFVGHALRTVEGRWGELSVEVVQDTPDTPLAWVGGQAFADEPRRRPAPSLQAFSAATPAAEVREIAHRVKRLVAAGTAPERIAVCFRDLADDTEALVEALENLGVPARARLGVPLAESPLGRLALSLFELVEDEFPAAQVAALLQSRSTRGVWAGAPELLRWLPQAGIRDDRLGAQGSRGAWTVRLEALAVRLEAVQRREQAGEVRQLRAAAERVVALGRAIPSQGRAAELLEAWWRSVSALGLERALRSREPHREGLFGRVVERALARDQAAAEALEGLVVTLREALERSGLGDQPLTRRELWRWVRRAAADVNLTARGARTGAVWLLDARELVGRRFQHVFVGGLLDGRFPGRPAPLAVFSEEERAQLNAAGSPLFSLGVADGDVHLPARLAEDRLLLHAALSAATGTATVSHARSDEAGRELPASPFLDALARAVEGFRVEAVSRAVSLPLEACASEAELRERVALEVCCPPATRQSERDPRTSAMAEVLRESWLEEAAALAEAEGQRLRFFTDPTLPAGPFSGRVDAPEVVARVGELLAFPPEHPASAHALDAWGTCAFQGLLENVLRLTEEEEQGEEPDARVRGSFWHAALREAVPVLAARGLLGRPAAPEAEVRAIVERAVAVAAVEVGSAQGTGHPVLWRLAAERAVTKLADFARSEAALPFPGAAPAHVELPFGSEEAPAALREVAVRAALPGEGDVYLRGRIDRVDVGASSAGVIDYKTKAGTKGVRGGKALQSEFQLPLYLRALRQLMPEAKLDAAWLGMADGSSLGLEALGRVEELLAEDAPTRTRLAEEGKLNLATAVHGLLGRLRGGDFGPRAESCEHCGFSSVCRISARKLRSEGGPG